MEFWGRGGGVGGGGGGGGAEGRGGATPRALPLVCEPGGDTRGALMAEEEGRGGGKGGGGGGGVGGGGAGTLGRGGTVLAAPCASEALPSLGDAGGLSGPLIVLEGSRGEGAREPGACPVLPPVSETSSELAQQQRKEKPQACGQQWSRLSSVMSWTCW